MIRLLLIAFFLFWAGNISFGQQCFNGGLGLSGTGFSVLKAENNNSGSSFYEWYGQTSEDFVKKPRPRFRKKRLGNNVIYVEGMGFGSTYTYYTVNYDLMLQSSEKTALTARLGAGTWNREIVVPLLINLLVGGRNCLELGFGGVYIDKSGDFNPAANIGYRYQNPKGGFMFKIAATPTIERTYTESGRELGKNVALMGGLSLGFSF